MDDTLKIALALAYGYVIGAVPMAFIVGKLVKGVDLRKVGSGTVGASNVWHNIGKFWMFPVGIFDLFIKGPTPVIVARDLLGLAVEWQVAAALLGIVGHNWPVFLGFQGGRGVAPTTGVLLALARPELAVFVVLTTAGWRLTNAAAVWVLLGFALMPALAVWWGRPQAIVWLLVGILAVTVAKRVASNSKRPDGMPLGRLLFNRLVYDRDIADNEAWVHRRRVAG